jgi:hypothetical protein
MKDAYYFSHDCNARHDPKILKVRAKYGSQGYAWYFMIIEFMREQYDYSIDYDDLYAVAMDLQCECNALQGFIEFCISIGLLWITPDNKLMSKSLSRRMEKYLEKSEKARSSAKKRWDANAMRTHSEGNALKQSKAKESKANEVAYSPKDFKLGNHRTVASLLNYIERLEIEDSKKKDIKISIQSAAKQPHDIWELWELIETSLCSNKDAKKTILRGA